jgi:hypothetical protein
MPRLRTALRIGAVFVVAGLLSACYGYAPRPYYATQGHSGYIGHAQGYSHGYGYRHGYRGYSRYRYRYRSHGY